MGTISDPKIGVALGGGAARGLIHIPFIEAMDELGLKPHNIAGTSIGALLGAGWAAGLTGGQIREYAYDYLGDLRTIISRVWTTRLKSFASQFRIGLSVQLDAVEVITSFVPDDLPKTFDELKYPLAIVATDFKTWHPVVFRTGPVIEAIAASIAIPSIFKPVEIEGRTLLDGSVVNPLPLDVASRGADILVGVDVSGDASDFQTEGPPSVTNAWMGSAQIMIHGLVSYALVDFPPDVYVRPDVTLFGAMEFWRVREIVESGDKDKDRFKRQLSGAIEKFIASQQKSV